MTLGRVKSWDSDRFRLALQDRQLTHVEFANQLGVNRRVVKGWAMGQMVPSVQRLPEIVERLGVSPFWLFGKTEDEADLVDLRVVRGLNLKEVSEKTGCGYFHLYDAESGMKLPSDEACGALAECYQVSKSRVYAAWIMSRIENYGRESLKLPREES